MLTVLICGKQQEQLEKRVNMRVVFAWGVGAKREPFYWTIDYRLANLFITQQTLIQTTFTAILYDGCTLARRKTA